MIRKTILIIISLMMVGCYTQLAHNTSDSNITEERNESKYRSRYYSNGECIEYSYHYNSSYQNSLVWDRWRNCWVYDPHAYNGYYNDNYNWWYWHHYGGHQNGDSDYVPPTNDKKERRNNNYNRPSNSNNESDDSQVSSSSNNKSDNKTKDKKTKKDKRTKTREKRK